MRAGQPFAAIDRGFGLKGAATPCASAKSRSVEPPTSSARASVPRTAANRRCARGPADAVGGQPRVDAGLEQGLAGVDVARAHHHLTAQQQALDGRAAQLQAA
jgi:hypothetical protein